MPVAWRSTAHEVVDLRRGERALEVAEAPLLLYFLRGFGKAGHRRPVERGGEADTPHSGRLELRDAEGLAADAGHEVERPGERLAHRAHRSEVGKAGRHERSE